MKFAETGLIDSVPPIPHKLAVPVNGRRVFLATESTLRVDDSLEVHPSIFTN